MGTTNSEGIFEYDGTELGAPGPAYMEPLTDSITAQFTDVRAEITGLQLLTDSDWVNISTFGSGWASTGGSYQPRVRKVGDRVDLAGAVTRSGTSGAASNILTIPPGFRLAGSYGTCFIGAVVTSGGQVMQLLLDSSHRIQIPIGYASASIGSGVVLPLAASWYVN